MLNTINKRGFTLIELLVVIAIIGVLASVVFASLNIARDKGADAGVKSNLRGVRDHAALYYDTSGNTYTGVCLETNVVNALLSSQSLVSGIPTLGAFGDGECVDSNSAYAIWVNLKSASTTAYCVDAVMGTKIIPAQDSSAVDLLVCP